MGVSDVLTPFLGECVCVRTQAPGDLCNICGGHVGCTEMNGVCSHCDDLSGDLLHATCPIIASAWQVYAGALQAWVFQRLGALHATWNGPCLGCQPVMQTVWRQSIVERGARRHLGRVLSPAFLGLLWVNNRLRNTYLAGSKHDKAAT